MYARLHVTWHAWVQGIAKMLINAAMEEAARRGVQHMYVHVAADNTAARQLYIEQCGFRVEQEESEGFARALNRPRRLLLWRPLASKAVPERGQAQ
jgi:ribosomal protein S18 acetylase RimI-like enzyme